MTNYTETLNIPKSNMPSKYEHKDPCRLRSIPWSNEGDPFVITDGPPYANGNIHMGHALNKLLKDTMLKAYRAFGYATKPLSAVWDCHGLPIEWAVEQQYRKNKTAFTKQELLSSCAEFALDWVSVQEEEFSSLGVMFDSKTTTMLMRKDIVGIFHKMLPRLYSAKKPVLWSHVERTSLADAETVDVEKEVDTLWVYFPVEGEDSFVLVWTTTPWSLPANVALSFSNDFEYGLYEVEDKKVYMSDWAAQNRYPNSTKLSSVSYDELKTKTVRHPLSEFDDSKPLVLSSNVVETTGSGFVHIGPAHDVNDWYLWKNMGNTDFPEPVLDNGLFKDDVPLVGGMNAIKGKNFGNGNNEIVDVLVSRNMAECEKRTLTLPHSWRSGSMLYSLATRQWFLSIDEKLKEDTVNALSSIEFYPETSKNRLISMVKNRPDWLVSRQRAWGTPMALLVNKTSGEVNDDPYVLEMGRKYVDQWDTVSVDQLLCGTDYDPDAYEKVMDILDVWFDSACVSEVLNSHANLVIEGSDQSRGWFQVSALVGMMLNGELPFDAVMTHGFVLDKNGIKMSKSKKNVVDPMKMMAQYGPDVLRLWAVSSDSSKDVKFSEESLKTNKETFRKFYNTLRYLSGSTRVQRPTGNFEDIDLYILQRLKEVKDNLAKALEEYSLSQYVAILKDFCINDLSSFYFEARKDALYCGNKDEAKHIKHVMYLLYHNLAKMLYPVMPYACQQTMYSVRYQPITELCDYDWPEPVMDWKHLRAERKKVNSLIEEQRKKYPTNLHASIAVPTVSAAPSYVYGVSRVFVSNDDSPIHLVNFDDTNKCPRCWRHLELSDSGLCHRCDDVITEIERGQKLFLSGSH